MAVTLGELAVEFGLELHGDPDLTVDHVATLANAASNSVSFLANQQYRKQLATTGAGAVIVSEKDAADCPVAALVSNNPYAAYARIAARLHPPSVAEAGVHPSAVIGSGTHVPPSCHVGPQAVIGDHVSLGERVVVGAGSVIGPRCELGEDTRLVARVTIMDGVRLGKRNIIHPGAVIGGDGFGIAPDDGAWVKVPQVGGVLIGDDVEIGCNTTIDRGALDDTVIEDGVKLDNHIQIGHNVHVGAHTVMAAKVGVSGSTRIGKRCMIAGDAGFTGHLNIADDVVLTARAVLTHSVDKPGVYSGMLAADDSRTWLKNSARFRKLDELAKKVRRLEKIVADQKGRTKDE